MRQWSAIWRTCDPLECRHRARLFGQLWLTFRQALSLGGHVRKGEHGTTVFYADRFIPNDERERSRRDGDEPRAIPFLKRFTVFNTDQCDGLPQEIPISAPPVPEGLILPQAEALIASTAADLRVGGDRAYYDILADYIHVPPPQAYFEPVNWHRTALHELGHWSGAAHRLGRDLSGSFGSKSTLRKNLLPKRPPLSFAPRLASCRQSGTPITSVPGSRSCAKTTEPSFAPASAASKAADFILAFRPPMRRCLPRWQIGGPEPFG